MFNWVCPKTLWHWIETLLFSIMNGHQWTACFAKGVIPFHFEQCTHHIASLKSKHNAMTIRCGTRHGTSEGWTNRELAVLTFARLWRSLCETIKKLVQSQKDFSHIGGFWLAKRGYNFHILLQRNASVLLGTDTEGYDLVKYLQKKMIYWQRCLF